MGHRLEARHLAAVYGERALQVAVDRIVVAVRSGDDPAVVEADRVLRYLETEVGHRQAMRTTDLDRPRILT